MLSPRTLILPKTYSSRWKNKCGQDETEGLKQSEILRAEGDAQARVQKANAESEGIRLVSDAFKGTGDPTNHLIATRYIDTLSPMVSGKDNKVIYIPYEATGVLSSLGGIMELSKGQIRNVQPYALIY